MKTYTVCLRLAFEARSEEEALEIAQLAKATLTPEGNDRLHPYPYKVAIDIVDLGEL